MEVQKRGSSLNGVVESKQHQSCEQNDDCPKNRLRRQTLSKDAECESHAKQRHQIKRRRGDHDIDGPQRPEKKHHRDAVKKDREISERGPLGQRKLREEAQTVRLQQKKHRQTENGSREVAEEKRFDPREEL